jgi:hypothetical protein
LAGSLYPFFIVNVLMDCRWIKRQGIEKTKPAASKLTMPRDHEAKPTNPGKREASRVGAGSKPVLQHLETISDMDTLPAVL